MTVAEDKRSARRNTKANLLQTFHNPTTDTDRENAKRVLEEAMEMERNGEMDPIREAMENGTAFQPTWMNHPEAERKAVQFIRGGTAQPELIEVQGWMVNISNGMVTEKQASWMISIAHRPSVTDQMRESLKVRLEQGMARSAGSAFITKYKDIPTAAAETLRDSVINPGPGTTPAKIDPASLVPAGRYAVEEEGVLKFFRITKGKGRWAGRTFVEIQASDDRYAVRSPGRCEAILKSIAKDLESAERRYGQELGKCSRCGRTLTDETSRAYGIGPECRKK